MFVMIIIIGAVAGGIAIIAQGIWALFTGDPVTLAFYGSSAEHEWYTAIAYGIGHVALGGIIYFFSSKHDEQKKS